MDHRDYIGSPHQCFKVRSYRVEPAGRTAEPLLPRAEAALVRASVQRDNEKTATRDTMPSDSLCVARKAARSQ